MWRLLQLVIIFGTVYFFNEVEPAPEAALGHKVLFGFILAYATTWMLSKCYDLLLLLRRRTWDRNR